MAESAVVRALRAENAELRVTVAALRAAVVELEVANAALTAQVTELSRRLSLSPRNSDKPPSSQGYDKPAPRSRREVSGRRSGGQSGHRGSALRQSATPDEIVVCSPQACAGCGASLAAAPVVSVEIRQVVDLPPIRVRVTEYQVEHRQCPCHRVTMAAISPGMGAPVQYGPGVRAVATYLMGAHFLPLARTCELLSDLFGVSVSQGTVQRWAAVTPEQLEPFLSQVKLGLVSSAVLGMDETGIRVQGSLWWVHAARTDHLTLYAASTKRGVEAMDDVGVLGSLPASAMVVHDCWAPYWHYPVRHALCGAHLGRELVAASDIGGQACWAQPLDRLLREINQVAIAARAGGATCLSPALLSAYQRRWGELIQAGWAVNPEHHRGGRGKSKRPKHVSLLDRLDTHRVEVLRYATDLRVPFTNNGSEQDIRPLKIRMKIAGCLRTPAGAKAFCALRSYLSTARKQGQSAYAVLRDLHDGNPWLPEIPTLPATAS